MLLPVTNGSGCVYPLSLSHCSWYGSFFGSSGDGSTFCIGSCALRGIIPNVVPSTA